MFTSYCLTIFLYIYFWIYDRMDLHITLTSRAPGRSSIRDTWKNLAERTNRRVYNISLHCKLRILLLLNYSNLILDRSTSTNLSKSRFKRILKLYYRLYYRLNHNFCLTIIFLLFYRFENSIPGLKYTH